MPLSSCGTQTVESSADRLMIENTVIVQHDPMVQDSWDSARKITCDWQSKLEKMVTFAPFPVADLQGVAEIKFAGSGDNVKTRMEIQVGRGPFAPTLDGLTKIGDELTVVVYVQDGGAGYDILVKNCHAYDSKDFQQANKIRLLSEHGCLYRPHQMEYFKRTFDVRSTGADIIAFARMNAFKFPDQMDVFLSCELEMCKGGCDTHCEMDDYPIDIIETLGHQAAPRAQEVEAAPPVTTFRPARQPKSVQDRKAAMVKRRRRLPKKFGSVKVEDEAASVLSPPATLSPEILELLQELSSDQQQASERSDQESLGTSRTQHVTAAMQFARPGAEAAEAATSTTEKISKMSFSTLFGGEGGQGGQGTHSTSNEIPAHILHNPDKFQPSALLSAAIERSAGPFPSTSTGGGHITSLSKGSTGAQSLAQGSVKFPPRVRSPVAAALQQPAAPLSAKLTNVMVHDITSPVFARSDRNAADLVQADLTSNSLSHASAQQQSYNNNNNQVNTLQQQLVSEGNNQAVNNFQNFQPVGGFLPMSTTPNILTSTVIFTSPRSVQQLQHLAGRPQPQEVLLQLLAAEQSPAAGPQLTLPHLPPQQQPRQLPGPRREGRRKFGSRLQLNTDRFAQFFGARKRREAADTDAETSDSSIRNVFAESETVNMIKGFQVVSASDLAFNPATLAGAGHLLEEAQEPPQEICFQETSFYAGLLLACSLLLVSGTVSVCSIRRIRQYQHSSGVKRMFFGDTGSTLDRYH